MKVCSIHFHSPLVSESFVKHFYLSCMSSSLLEHVQCLDEQNRKIHSFRSFQLSTGVKIVCQTFFIYLVCLLAFLSMYSAQIEQKDTLFSFISTLHQCLNGLSNIFIYFAFLVASWACTDIIVTIFIHVHSPLVPEWFVKHLYSSCISSSLLGHVQCLDRTEKSTIFPKYVLAALTMFFRWSFFYPLSSKEILSLHHLIRNLLLQQLVQIHVPTPLTENKHIATNTKTVPIKFNNHSSCLIFEGWLKAREHSALRTKV